MPGPWSTACTISARCARRIVRLSRISPWSAYFEMLRATSEIAVVIIVTSVIEKSSFVARSRPAWRAATMSSAFSMATTTSSSVIGVSTRSAPVEKLETLFEIEGGVDVLETHAQLHHRERDIGLDADHDGFRAAQV